MDTDRTRKELNVWGTTARLRPEELDPKEIWWRECYLRLKTCGYLLRPRYSPEWVPSWTVSKKSSEECEDGRRLRYGRIIDATRISDGKMVTLKEISRAEHPYEVDIASYFSSNDLVSKPANHCVPIVDVLTLEGDGDSVIIVMPLLRPYTNPRFDTVGEVVECFRQLFEGLHFMHKNHVAHRDCMSKNIMVDPTHLYPESFHPVEINLRKDGVRRVKHFTRTQRPSKYYFIDFGISRRYDPSIREPREIPIWGGDKEVPEFQNSNEPCDPFATDVFYIGNAIRKDFLLDKRGLEFMKPLIADMIQADPSKRPKMDEVVSRFEGIRGGLSGRTLRSRVVDTDEDLYERVVRTSFHLKRRMGFIARRIPAIPTLPS